MRNIHDLLRRAIEKNGDAGPAKGVSWKSHSNPLGQTSFLRFEKQTFKPWCRVNSDFVQGYEVDVWLNDCGNTFKTKWRFDYFPRHDWRVNILELLAGDDCGSVKE